MKFYLCLPLWMLFDNEKCSYQVKNHLQNNKNNKINLCTEHVQYAKIQYQYHIIHMCSFILCRIQLESDSIFFSQTQNIQSTSLQHLYVQMHFLNLPTEDKKNKNENISVSFLAKKEEQHQNTITQNEDAH